MVFAGCFSRSDIGCYSCPCTKPEYEEENIEDRIGVGISISPGSRPHWHHGEVDEGGEREPALDI